MIRPDSLTIGVGTPPMYYGSLDLYWEDNSGCASHLTSINLKLWVDGTGEISVDESVEKNNNKSVKESAVPEPITYAIPRSCLKNRENGNLFSVSFSSDNPHYSSSPCMNSINWKPLLKCRKYLLGLESVYSSAWKRAPPLQTIFTSTGMLQYFYLFFKVYI